MNEVSSAGRVVVGVDGSPSSVDALRWAATTAAALGLEIDVITSWEYPMTYGMDAGIADYSPEKDADLILAATVLKAFDTQPPTGLRSRVVRGHPAQALLESSKNSEMLVLGSRGHGGFVGLLLGSVSAHCAEHSSCPVVIVRHRPAPSTAP